MNKSARRREQRQHWGAELLPTRRNNDFTVDVESQRPARRMGRSTLPICKWRKISPSHWLTGC